MKQKKLRDLKRGELFKRKPEAETVFIREHFNRAKKGFYSASITCSDWYDINREIYLNPNKLVFVGFDF